MYKSPLKIILVVVLFFAVSWAVYYFFYILPGKSQFDIRKFGGNVASIEDDLVTLNGVFIPAPAGSLDLSAKRNFTFRVDEETRLSKIEIKWPTWEEVAAAPEGRLKFSVEDLPSEQKEGDIEDLRIGSCQIRIYYTQKQTLKNQYISLKIRWPLKLFIN